MKKLLIIAFCIGASVSALNAVLPRRHDKITCITMNKNKICYSYNSGLYQKCINSCEEANPKDDTACEVFCQRKYFKIMDV